MNASTFDGAEQSRPHGLVGIAFAGPSRDIVPGHSGGLHRATTGQTRRTPPLGEVLGAFLFSLHQEIPR